MTRFSFFIIIIFLATGCTTTRKYLQFDGKNDYIDLGNVYDDVQLPVTLTAWVWIDSTADKAILPIFDSQDGLPIYNGFNFITGASSFVAFQYGDGVGENHYMYRRAKTVRFPTVSGKWVHLATVARSAQDMDLYMNGVDMGGEYVGGSNLPMNSNSPQEHAKIGALLQNSVQFWFKGKLDDLKIWNRALSPAEIKESMKEGANAQGLIGYWDFNESTGDVIKDKSPNKFHGTMIGKPVRVAEKVKKSK